MARRIWLSFAILLLSCPHFSSSQSCAGRCTCRTKGIKGQHNYEKVVNCSGRALSSVPNSIPSDSTELNLRNNAISWLDTNIFRILPKLQKVDFSNNKLQSLPRDVFSFNPSLHEVNLSGNPLTCDCNLYSIYNVSQHLNSSHFSGMCSNPPSLANRHLRSLKVYEFCGGCAGVKATGQGSHDKEYFIHINAKCQGFASVYCHGMSTNSPQEYISLRSGPSYNYAFIYDYKQPEIAKYECEKQNGGFTYSKAGLTNFTKVRLILSPNSAIIKTDDFQFASKVGNNVPLGVAGDCYSASSSNCRKGRFKIDLTGTGFRLKEGVHWEHYGTPSNIHNTLEMDSERSIVYGECGGYCGGCRPRGHVELELDSCLEEGVKPCSSSLGMDDRSIDDSQITASSNTPNYLPHYGRLNNIKSASMGGSWCARTSDLKQYLQIDMKKKMTFSGIATQGAGDAQNWLTKFKIMKSNDGISFTDHTEFGVAKDFFANKDNFNVVTNWFSQRFRARHIRIVPLEWNNAICLRAEVYGCDNDIVSIVVRHKTDKRCWSPFGSKECNIDDGTSLVLKSDCQGSGVMMTFHKNNTIRHTCSGKCASINNNYLLILKDGPCDTFRKQQKGQKGSNEWIIVHEKTKLCVNLGDIKTGQLLLTSCSHQQTLFELSQDDISPLPPIITFQNNNYLEVNKPGWVHCKVISDPRAQIFWSRNRPWPSGQKLSKLEFLQTLHGSLYVRKARMSYSGRYYCSAANTADFKFGSLDVIVGSPPNITKGPVDTKVVLNMTAVLNCKVANTKLPTKIFWYKRSVKSSNAISVDKLDQHFLVLTNMSLQISRVEKNDEAHYLCVAKNPLGSDSGTAFLKVLIPPSINNFPKDIEVPSSSSPMVNCKAVGDPPPVIRWSRKGSSNLPKGFKVYSNGSLFMRDIAKVDQGLYICSALNEAGTRKVQAMVKVYVACRIDSIPYATYAPNQMFFRVGESAVVTCKTGYQMREGLELNITCLASGKFDKPIPKCKDTDECRINPSTEQNSHNVTSYHKCDRNALCINTAGSYRCECKEGYEGNGSICNPLCKRPKTPLNAKHWLPEQKYYDTGVTITLVCEPGFEAGSKPTVTCNNSFTSFGRLPECKDIDECTLGVQDIEAGKLHSACHNEAECRNTIGSYRCTCKSGYEGDGFKTCIVAKERMVMSSSGKKWKYSPKMDTVQNMLKEYKAKNTTAMAVLDVLENKTCKKEEKLTSGDLIVVFKTVKELLNDVKTPGTQDSKTKELKSVTKVCSNILAEDNKERWDKLQKDSKGVTEVMKLLEDYTSALAEDVVTLKANSSLTLKADNIEMQLQVFQAKELYDGHRYPKEGKVSQVIVPGEVFHDYKSGLQSIRIIGINYKSLGKLLPNRAEGVKKFDVESSSIISTSIHPRPAMHDGKLASPVRIVLVNEKTTEKSTVPMCVFWDFKKDYELGGSWSSQGCRVASSDKNVTVCECDHMTSFASLAVYDKELVFTLVVYICCGILLLVVLILAVRHLCLHCKKKSERSIIHLNLYFAIAAAIGLFIGALKLTDIKVVCILVAALLHYFFVAMFSWIMVKCLQIYMTLATGKNKNSSRLKWFYIVGWLLPAIVVGVSLGVFQLKGYGNSDWCWLNYNDLLMWAFAGPAAACFLITLMFVIMISVLKGRVVDSSDKSKVSLALLLAVLLEIAIAGTWVAAAIYVKHHQARLWEYLFAGSCALQAFILLLFGLLDKEIKNFSFVYQIKKIQQREHKEKRNYYSTTDTVQYYGAANAPDGKTYTVTRPSAKESTGDLRGSSKRLSRIGSNQEVNDPSDYPPPIFESPVPLDESYRRKVESQPIPYTPSHPNSEVIQLQTFPVRKASSETHSRFSNDRQPDGAEDSEPSLWGDRTDRYYSLPRNIDTSSNHSKLEQIPERAPLLSNYREPTDSETTPKELATEPRASDSETEPLTSDPSRRRSSRLKTRLEERYKMDRDSINRRKRNLRYSSGFVIGATLEEEKSCADKDHASL